jgi:hypothetical protein
MKLAAVLLIGAVIGALDGGGVFFAPGEPYRIEIFAAAILKGVLVALMIALSLRNNRSLVAGAGLGLLYGFAFGLVVFLAKGGLKSMDAPYVVPSGAVMGAITGLLVAKLAFRRADAAPRAGA